MPNKNVLRLVLAAVLTSLCCVATLIIRIPSPSGGYINPGDAIVLFSAFILGPAVGAVSAGVGSALADVFAGYVLYAPATLIIKAAMAITAGLIYKALKEKNNIASLAVAGVAAEIIMILGYFFFESVVLGYGLAAAAEIIGNCVQGLFGVIAGSLLHLAVGKRVNLSVKQ